MQKTKRNLPIPFSHYWKSYSNGECPFCKSERVVCSKHKDLFWCRVYATYVSDFSCEGIACASEGQCDNCCDNCGPTIAYILREEVEDEVFLCENCHQGVNFTEMKLITDFLKLRKESALQNF